MSTALPQKKILLVDDHALVREGLAEVINKTPGLWVCAEAATPGEALRKIPETHPDLALVDLSLAESSGLDLVKDLRIRHPALPVLVLSMHDESFYAERALRAGAKGYVMKRQPVDDLRAALLQVLSGGVYLSPRISQRLLSAFSKSGTGEAVSPQDRLSDRELEVLTLIGRGRRITDIAAQLHLSVKTIETYQARLKEKLGLRDASELFQHALHWSTQLDGRG
jgi:DNA-binding NarL/FixJ family response regulator